MNATLGMGGMRGREARELGYRLNMLFWSLGILSGSAIGLRLYTKTNVQQARLWWDDWIAVASWMLILMQNVAAIFEIRDGEGRHVSTLRSEELSRFTMSADVAATIAIVVTASSKSAFCATLLKGLGVWPDGGDAGQQATRDQEVARLRAIRETRAAANRDGQATVGVLRGIVWAVLVGVNLVSMLAGVLLWIRCSPIEKAWHPNLRGTCWGQNATIIPPMVNTAFSGAMDVVLCIVPLYMLRNTPLRRGERAGVMFCLLLGLFAAATGFLKTTEMHVLAGIDVTYDIMPLTIWGSAEPNLILVAISLPEARHLIWKGNRYDGRPPTPQGMRDAVSNLPAATAAPDEYKMVVVQTAAHPKRASSGGDAWGPPSHYGGFRQAAGPRGVGGGGAGCGGPAASWAATRRERGGETWTWT